MAKFGHNRGPLSGRKQVDLKNKARAELEYRIGRKLPISELWFVLAVVEIDYLEEVKTAVTSVAVDD
ncbi:13727_t:CDS:2 [Gigaspora margarita]|uniref:13727_t:CDS:1 n=1 Tax=Gigaspora margarita TaxID=4874 RepID=A0ABN7VKW9_GIGMA|nr:13727_t:CDS:2 [Gigaspora margarita]